MNYAKPEVQLIRSALDAIRAQDKHGMQPDTTPNGGKPTNGAYEADE